MSHVRRFAVAVALGVFFVGMNVQRAQGQAPPPPPPQLPTVRETVQVVATRTPEAPSEVPLAVEVISGDELRDRGVTDLPGALALATGVDIAPGGDGGPAGSVPEFWGLREFDAFLLVVDDVPWGGAFNPALTTVSLVDVERIEILRGPAPVIYGATSFVGVIHVVHKGASEASQSVSARFGTYQSGGGLASFVIPTGSWQSRLSVDGDRQGFQDDRTSFGRGHILWRSSRTTSTSRLWFGVDGTLLNQSPASPVPRVGASLSPLVPLDANHNPAGAFLNDRRVSAWFGFERAAGARTWTTTVSVSHSSNDILRGFLEDISDPEQNARGLREQTGLTDVYADSHAGWNPVGRVHLLLGGDYLHGSGEAKGADFDYFVPLNGATAVTVAAPSTLDVTIDDRRDFIGLYASAEWKPAEHLRIDAGLRLNITNEEHEGGDAADSSQGGAQDAGAQTNVRPSGSLGAIWSAWSRGANQVRVFGNYRNTFKPAAVDFGIGEGEVEGPLKPETSQSYEGGVKTAMAGGRLSLEATAFLMDFDNLVVADTVNGLPALTNAGTQRFKGVEIGGAWFLMRNLSGRASFSLHDARFRDYVFEFDGVPTQLGGKQLEMSARHLASAGLVYAPAHGVTALIEVNEVGSRFLNRRNTAVADPYATLSAGAGYRARLWELRVDGRNLTDQRPPVSESELGEGQYYRLPGIRVDATVTVRFAR